MAVATTHTGAMPMMAVQAAPQLAQPSQPTVTAQAVTDGGAAAHGYLPFEGDRPIAGDGLAIGIDLGAANIRAAVWDADQMCAEPILFGPTEEPTLPCWIAYSSPSKALVGEEAVEAAMRGEANPLLGVQRLLGRSYASLGGAKFLDQEAPWFPNASLVAEEEPASASGGGDDGEGGRGGVRVKMTFNRPKSSGLRKRGAAPELKSGDEGKGKGKDTVDVIKAPEELLYKLLAKVKEAAEAQTGQEVTHAALVIPADWGLLQRRAAFDPKALLGGDARLIPDPSDDASAATKPRHRVLSINWGAGACAAAVLEGDATKAADEDVFEGQPGGGWIVRPDAIVAVGATEEGGGMAMDRLVAATVLEQVKEQVEAAGGDATSDKTRLQALLAAERLKLRLFGENGAAKLAADEEGELQGAGDQGWKEEDDEEGQPRLMARTIVGETEAEAVVAIPDTDGDSAEVSLTATDWAVAVKPAWEAVEEMVTDVIQRGGGGITNITLSGGVIGCPPARCILNGVLSRILGEGIRKHWMDCIPHLQANGAAIVAAQRLDPVNFEAAWLEENGFEWSEPFDDVLPMAVSVEGAGGKRTTLFPPLTPLTADGRTERLSFDAQPYEQHVRLLEGDSASGGATPLLDLVLPAAPRRRRPLFARRKEDKKRQSEAVVQLLPSGVLEADVDADDDEEEGGGKSRLGVCSLLLLLVLIAASVLGVAQPQPPQVEMRSASAAGGNGEGGAGAGGAQEAEV